MTVLKITRDNGQIEGQLKPMAGQVRYNSNNRLMALVVKSTGYLGKLYDLIVLSDSGHEYLTAFSTNEEVEGLTSSEVEELLPEVLTTELVIKDNSTLDSPDVKSTRIYVDEEEYPSGLKFWNSEMYGRGLRVTDNSEYNFTAENIKELKNKVEELESKVSELTEANSKLEKLTLTYFSEIFKELVRVSNLVNKRMKLGK